MRRDGLAEVKTLFEQNKFVTADLGQLPSALAKRLDDVNKVLQATVIEIYILMAASLGAKGGQQHFPKMVAVLVQLIFLTPDWTKLPNSLGLEKCLYYTWLQFTENGTSSIPHHEDEAKCWRFPSRYADPGSLSILSRITLHLIDDADRAVLGDTLAHMAAQPGNSIIDAFETCSTWRFIGPQVLRASTTIATSWSTCHQYWPSLLVAIRQGKFGD